MLNVVPHSPEIMRCENRGLWVFMNHCRNIKLRETSGSFLRVRAVAFASTLLKNQKKDFFNYGHTFYKPNSLLTVGVRFRIQVKVVVIIKFVTVVVILNIIIGDFAIIFIT